MPNFTKIDLELDFCVLFLEIRKLTTLKRVSFDSFLRENLVYSPPLLFHMRSFNQLQLNQSVRFYAGVDVNC